MKKKVLCLYRVSTKMQVNRETDDIPMQKAECVKFIAGHRDWEFYDEIAEKGISGFKNTSHSRDALNEIMERAHKKEFDILLVYMSDRLGRREDDTPFYVADLNNLGIEVWSVNENQLKTEEHIDKLMNYIRFWNAEGESLKTSVRVRDAQLEMVKRGEYTGGGCPYGYRQIYSGKYNNKGRALKKLEINPAEAAIVRKIYELSTFEGMGGYRIAQELNNAEVPTQKGSKWTLCTVNNILRNPIYKGYYSYGKGKVKGKRGRTSPDEWVYSPAAHPELAIIEEKFWDKAQKVRKARTPEHFRKENMSYEDYPARTGGKLLLMGFVYCGYCGSRLSNGSAYDKWTTRDGIRHTKIRGQYKCISKTGGNPFCQGKFVYKQERLEEAVLDAVSGFMSKIRTMDIYPEFLKEQQSRKSRMQRELQAIRQKIKAIEKDLETLKDQLPQALRNEFVLPLSELEELINTDKRKLEAARAEFLLKQREIAADSEVISEADPVSSPLPAWEEFDKLDIAKKRMVLATIINRIYVREESVNIEMKIDAIDLLPPDLNSDASTSHCIG